MQNETYEVSFGGQSRQNCVVVDDHGDHFARISIVGRNGKGVTLDAKRLQHHIEACQTQLAEMLGKAEEYERKGLAGRQDRPSVQQ